MFIILKLVAYTMNTATIVHTFSFEVILFMISRDADLEVDNDLLIGPPPPAMVAEVESANEAERFEEVLFPFQN